MTQILFLNGPPHSGKDFAANYICATRTATHYKFAAPIKKAISAITGLSVAALEKRKNDLATPFDVTYRQLMIGMSETWCKPLYGMNIFGRLLLDQIRQDNPARVVISDSGFVFEAMALINYFGSKACTLIRLHRDGCTFSNDSRSYIQLQIESADLYNSGGAEFLVLLNQYLLGLPKWS